MIVNNEQTKALPNTMEYIQHRLAKHGYVELTERHYVTENEICKTQLRRTLASAVLRMSTLQIAQFII